MKKPVCVVVGVGPGNGAAFARRFSEGGFAVALFARKLELTNQLAAELPDARAYVCDVTDTASIERAFGAVRQELGEVDVLIYNAGSGTWGTVEEITPRDFELALRVNASGLLASAQAVIAAMKAKKKGSIVVIGATASRRGGEAAPKRRVSLRAKPRKGASPNRWPAICGRRAFTCRSSSSTASSTFRVRAPV